MKKSLGIIMCIFIFGLCTATDISFSPKSLDIGKGCLLATDILIDTENKKISATDIILESSLEFVDFVPKETFPYFLPPKTTGNVVHIVGFTTNSQQYVTGKSSIGTLYFRQKDSSDTEGSIRLYFKNTGDTTDTNLSIAGGIDVLDSVGVATYTFIDKGVCIHGSSTSENIEGGIAKTKLKILLAKVDRDQLIKKIFNQKTIISFVGLLAIIILLFLYYKTKKQGKKI